MCSSRLLRRGSGRAYAVEVTVADEGVEAGHRYRILGDEITVGTDGALPRIGWTGQTGRPATPRERAEARAPYEANSARRAREQRHGPLRLDEHDDADDDALALEFCRRSQEREPVDLLGVI